MSAEVERVHLPIPADDPPGGVREDTLAALLEQAEADAAAAEAAAVSARARAEAIRLRNRMIADDNSISDMMPPSSAEAVAEEPLDAKPLRRRIRLQRPGRRIVIDALTILVATAALTLSGLLFWMHHQSVAKAQRAEEFQAAARQGVLALTSLDFANAQQDVDNVLSQATGTFKDEFRRRADDFKKVIESSEVVSQGRIFATGVESMTNDSAVVLVAATSEITSPPDAKEAPRGWRLAVTVTRDVDGMKLSNVEFVK